MCCSITYPDQKMCMNISCLVNLIIGIEMEGSYVCVATFSSLVRIPLITEDGFAPFLTFRWVPGALVRGRFPVAVQGALISTST